ncbi:MAG: hypothetical protein E7179_03265 [Erysipelotrichaceae bacterium]|jgi:hypothetical protein|nr:hypothetical protein [Erysipelotrichaceae bacterium]
MKGRRKKTKYSMVFATMVAMLSVCTAGVSTFAWFQASSEVRVSAASSSTTITVADPNETIPVGLYVYSANNGGNEEGGESSKRTIIPAPRPSNAAIAWNTTNFPQLVATNETSQTFYTSASNFVPGQTINFAIEINADTAKERELSLIGFTKTSLTYERRLWVSNSDKSKVLVLAQAINVYATAFASDDASLSTKIGQFLSGNTVTDDADAQTDKFTYDVTASNPTSYSLTTTPRAKHVYIFYTIELDDTTEHYQRTDSSGNPIYTSPSPATPPATGFSEVTYWRKHNGSTVVTSSSEVFQGLMFNITSLLIM